jgi:hypothetical protein
MAEYRKTSFFKGVYGGGVKLRETAVLPFAIPCAVNDPIPGRMLGLLYAELK